MFTHEVKCAVLGTMQGALVSILQFHGGHGCVQGEHPKSDYDMEAIQTLKCMYQFGD